MSRSSDEAANEVLAILDGLIHNEQQRAKALAGGEVIGKIKDADEIMADLDYSISLLKDARISDPDEAELKAGADLLAMVKGMP